MEGNGLQSQQMKTEGALLECKEGTISLASQGSVSCRNLCLFQSFLYNVYHCTYYTVGVLGIRYECCEFAIRLNIHVILHIHITNIYWEPAMYQMCSRPWIASTAASELNCTSPYGAFQRKFCSGWPSDFWKQTISKLKEYLNFASKE